MFAAQKVGGKYVINNFKSSDGWVIKGQSGVKGYDWFLTSPAGKETSITVINAPKIGEGTWVAEDGTTAAEDAAAEAESKTKDLGTICSTSQTRLVAGIAFIFGNPQGVISIAMCNATISMVNFLQQSIGFFGSFLEYLLNMPSRMMDAKLGTKNPIKNPVQEAWGNILRTTLLLLTLALIIIAFANILNLDEKLGYGLNRMIPRIIIAMVMAYFSFLIARVLLDLASAMQVGLFKLASDMGGPNIPANAVDLQATLKADLNSLPMLLLLLVIFVLLFLATGWLMLLLVVRVAIIWILVALAPAAMLMNILPFTESLYQKWWKEWWQWLFMGPAIAAMLYLSSVVLQAFSASFQTGQIFEGYMSIIMATVCVFLAGTIPFTMGGKIMSSVSNAMKVGGGFAGKHSGVSDFLGVRRSTTDQRRKIKAQNRQGKLGMSGSKFKRFVAGTTEKDVPRLRTAAIEAAMKDMPSDIDLLKQEFDGPDNIRAAAAAHLLLPNKQFKTDEPENVGRVTKLLDLAQNFDNTLTGDMIAKQSELFAGYLSDDAGRVDAQIDFAKNFAASQIYGVPAQEWTASHGRYYVEKDVDTFVRTVTDKLKMTKVKMDNSETNMAVIGEGIRKINLGAAAGDARMIQAQEQINQAVRVDNELGQQLLSFQKAAVARQRRDPENRPIF